MNVTEFATKSIDHLGLVSVLCKKLGKAEFIDERLPKKQTQFHITHGQLLVSMILNGLGFVGITLHILSDYLPGKPVERLIGPGINANHINDDALERCLDRLYGYGVSSLCRNA